MFAGFKIILIFQNLVKFSNGGTILVPGTLIIQDNTTDINSEIIKWMLSQYFITKKQFCGLSGHGYRAHLPVLKIYLAKQV